MPGPARPALIVPSVLAAVLVGGCDSGPTADPAPAAPGRSSTSSPPADAHPAAPCPTSNSYPLGATGFAEVRGDGPGVSLWALLFVEGNTLRVGREAKIAFRMTGTGDLTIQATGPGGTVLPVWGPEEHGGSSWRRPGDEWGTGWVFPSAGCWTVQATRTGVTATVGLRAG